MMIKYHFYVEMFTPTYIDFIRLHLIIKKMVYALDRLLLSVIMFLKFSVIFLISQNLEYEKRKD